jgi:hypothetical protein
MNVANMTVSAGTVSAGRRFAVLAIGMTLSVLVTAAAWSQSVANSPVSSIGRSNRAAASQDKPPEPAPDAIPGATAREPAAPASKSVGDLSPTDALFDSINRGDIAAARDALNRGADLNAVNILGMTPMELSVDLSRNDISFLLLSMRGEDSDRGSRAVAHDTPLLWDSGKTAQAGKARKSGKPATAGKTAAANTRVAPKPTPPKQFAKDPGTPLPSAGFLGFGSQSASN